MGNSCVGACGVDDIIVDGDDDRRTPLWAFKGSAPTKRSIPCSPLMRSVVEIGVCLRRLVLLGFIIGAGVGRVL